MYELKINSHVIGTFKTLREARAYEPDWVDAIAAGINTHTGNYYRIITKVRFNRLNDAQKSGAQNEIV